MVNEFGSRQSLRAGSSTHGIIRSGGTNFRDDPIFYFNQETTSECIWRFTCGSVSDSIMVLCFHLTLLTAFLVSPKTNFDLFMLLSAACHDLVPIQNPIYSKTPSAIRSEISFSVIPRNSVQTFLICCP